MSKIKAYYKFMVTMFWVMVVFKCNLFKINKIL